jgi:brefeldin A-resistance guanine nucleotide exchange factor 1
MASKVKQVNCVKGEIHNLLAVMRFMPDFSPNPTPVRPNQYTSDFNALFEQLVVCSDPDEVDYYAPFLRVIQANDVSGPITGVALSSIHKFLLYGFIPQGAGVLLNSIVNSVVQCTFPLEYTPSEEVVVMKLLHVFLECLRTQAVSDKQSTQLTDGSVWSMLKRGFETFEKPGISELLKKTTQNCLMQMFMIIFGRLANLEFDPECYGVPCILHTLVHLSKLIGWSDREDSTWKEKRCLGLFLLNTALETAGEAIGSHEKLVGVIQDDICKSLLVNSVTDDLFILSLMLRVVFNLFQSVKRHLKVQLEVFFNSIHLKLAANFEEAKEPVVFQQAELALESLIDFCREPSLVLELYTNYDCDVHFANLFEALAKFLCKHAFPLHGVFHRLNELSIQGLKCILSSIAMRCQEDERRAVAVKDPGTMREKKALKERMVKSAAVFNSKQKTWLQRLQEQEVLPRNAEPSDIAGFFKENPAVDKEAMGEYMGKNEAFNIEVMNEYAKLFDYSSLRIDNALKVLLSSFQMPGEAQIIGRVMDSFSSAYYAPDSMFANIDAVYILGYSIIQLNTDQHNQGVKVRMTEDDYARNLRATNGGADFPRTLLNEIYSSIKNEAIQVLDLVHNIDSEELGDPEVANKKWWRILKRNKVSGTYSTLDALLYTPAAENEKDMFVMVLESGLLNTLGRALEVAEDVKVLSVVQQVVLDVAKIANYFEMTEIVGKLVGTFTQLYLDSATGVFELYLSPKAHFLLEAIVGSSLICREHLETVWAQLIQLLLRLHSFQLLPSSLVELDDFLDLEGHVLPFGSHANWDAEMVKHFNTHQKSRSVSDKSEEEPELAPGFWGSVSSYLGMSKTQQKSKETLLTEMRHELKSRVTKSGLHVLFSSHKSLPIDSLAAYLKALIQVHRDYEEEVSVVLCLELLTNAVNANVKRMSSELRGLVMSHLERIIADSSVRYSWRSERALVSLFRISIVGDRRHFKGCVYGDDSATQGIVKPHVRTTQEDLPEINSSLIQTLKMMSQFDHDLLSKFAERLIAGLLVLVKASSLEAVIHPEFWRPFTELLKQLAIYDHCANPAFEILSYLIAELPSIQVVPVSLFSELMDLLCTYIKRSSSPVPRIEQGFELINSLTKLISRLESAEAVEQWSKHVKLVGGLCREHRKELRNHAYVGLQKLLMGNIELRDLEFWHLWKETIERVLFPLVIEPFSIPKEMLKTISNDTSCYLKHEFERSRARAVDLLCKTFMLRLTVLQKCPEFPEFWDRLIGLLNQTLVNRKGDQINEQTFETVKNLLLVLKTEEGFDLWDTTWAKVECTALKDEIEPAVA